MAVAAMTAAAWARAGVEVAGVEGEPEVAVAARMTEMAEAAVRMMVGVEVATATGTVVVTVAGRVAVTEAKGRIRPS